MLLDTSIVSPSIIVSREFITWYWSREPECIDHVPSNRTALWATRTRVFTKVTSSGSTSNKGHATDQPSWCPWLCHDNDYNVNGIYGTNCEYYSRYWYGIDTIIDDIDCPSLSCWNAPHISADPTCQYAAVTLAPAHRAPVTRINSWQNSRVWYAGHPQRWVPST